MEYNVREVLRLCVLQATVIGFVDDLAVVPVVNHIEAGSYTPVKLFILSSQWPHSIEDRWRHHNQRGAERFSSLCYLRVLLGREH